MIFPSFSELQYLVDARSKSTVVCTSPDNEDIRCGKGCKLRYQQLQQGYIRSAMSVCG